MASPFPVQRRLELELLENRWVLTGLAVDPTQLVAPAALTFTLEATVEAPGVAVAVDMPANLTVAAQLAVPEVLSEHLPIGQPALGSLEISGDVDVQIGPGIGGGGSVDVPLPPLIPPLPGPGPDSTPFSSDTGSTSSPLSDLTFFLAYDSPRVVPSSDLVLNRVEELSIQASEQGVTESDAVLDSGFVRQELILNLTTLTMAGADNAPVPLVELGADSETFQPMNSSTAGTAQLAQAQVAENTAFERALRDFLEQLPDYFQTISEGLARLGPWPWLFMSLALLGVAVESLRRLHQLRNKTRTGKTLEEDWCWAWHPELAGTQN